MSEGIAPGNLLTVAGNTGTVEMNRFAKQFEVRRKSAPDRLPAGIIYLFTKNGSFYTHPDSLSLHFARF